MHQQSVVAALRDPKTYDEDVSEIKLIQTHISYIFLTGRFAYKIKKPVNFGFLDFTSLEKRKFYCEEELRLNRRLCGDMYLRVVPINLSENGIKINGPGEILEYAVKMKEIPQNTLMSNLLKINKIDRSIMEEIAKILSSFHLQAETNEEIESYGSLDVIRFNWDENFNQTRDFIDKTISSQNFSHVKQVYNFMREKSSLFEERQRKNKIRECHGDLHSGNIFISDKIYIFDAIEFNKRFRFSDVASDIAFLTMDLEFKNKKELSEHFLSKYLEYSGEKEDFLDILPFYKCYRAYVRGKVTSFKLNDPNISKEEKNASKRLACQYFDLSLRYINELTKS